MSKRLQFYKLTIFSEEITEGFSQENISNSLKALFAGSDSYVEEMLSKHFSSLSLNYIDIDVSELKSILPDFNEKLWRLYSEKTSPFSIVDNKLWNAIQLIIYRKIKEELEPETKVELTGKLNSFCQISEDYALLSKLFKSKLLFVNFF